MTIETQKETANKVLKGLRIISPYAILAGGAPRDWWYGKEAKDLDFYFYSPAMTISAIKGQLQSILGVPVVVKGVFDNMLYKHMNFLHRIIEAEIDGIKCQFMQLREPRQEFNVLDKMSVSICKAWYTEARGVQLHSDFKLSIASGIAFLSEGYNWSDPHPAKIKEYLKDFKLSAGSSKQQAMTEVVNKQLRDIL